MSIVTSFPPIAYRSSKILVLGSMPGLASLKANQYYAHPRNSFWRIMANIYGFSAEAEYLSRVESLTNSGVAVWDVLQSCERPGSLDSAIVPGTRACNDFKLFFEQFTEIELIAFNGSEAQSSFNKLVLPKIELKDFHYVRLPSTSPAHTLALEQKTNAWKKALQG